MENQFEKVSVKSERQRIFTQRTLAICGIITAIILTILLIIYAVDALLVTFAAILLAVFLRSLSDFVSRRTGLSPMLSLVAVGLTLFAVFGLSLYLLAPNIAEQVRELQKELPDSLNNLRGRINETSFGHAILEQIPPTAEITDSLRNANLLSRATGFFSTTAGILTKFFIFLVLGLFLALEPQTYKRGFLQLVPQSRRKRAGEILDALGETLQWWLIGKFGSMLAIGILTWIGLMILGVPLALTLGILTALLTFIPNLGPVLSVIPAALLALSQDPLKAVYVIVLYIGVQIIESNLITPFIERRTVQLPPALTIATQLILSVFVGGLGLILATPLLAAAIVIVQMLYIEDILGDRQKSPTEQNSEAETPKIELDEAG